MKFQIAIRFSIAMSFFLVGDLLARQAVAGPPDSSRSAVRRLSDEFNLVPKLLSNAKGGTQQGDKQPLLTIARRMNVVHGDLSQFETDKPVQTRERQVVQSLDVLIAALERHCNGMGRGNIPGSGRKASIISTGSTAYGDLHGVNANARQWGQLPPKMRSEILQSKTDGFPPGYEALLQSYYQQLAEEKPIDDKSAVSPAGSGNSVAP
jgi:hypothetical protein